MTICQSGWRCCTKYSNKWRIILWKFGCFSPSTLSIKLPQLHWIGWLLSCRCFLEHIDMSISLWRLLKGLQNSVLVAALSRVVLALRQERKRWLMSSFATLTSNTPAWVGMARKIAHVSYLIVYIKASMCRNFFVIFKDLKVEKFL